VHPSEAAHVIVLEPARARDTLTTAFDSVRAGPDSLVLVRDSTGMRVLPPRRRRAAPPAPPGRP
jgi:hypothetical protein